MENKTVFVVRKLSERRLLIADREITLLEPNTYPSVHVEYKGMHLVLFSSTARGLTNSNVRAYNSKGDLLWEMHPEAPDSDGVNPYISIVWDDVKGKIAVQTWDEGWG